MNEGVINEELEKAIFEMEACQVIIDRVHEIIARVQAY